MKAVALITLLLIPISVLAGDLEDGRAAISAGDYARARTLLMPLAEAGNPVAQNAIGVLYMEGWGVKQDYSAALKWYRSAANSGDARAQYNVGRMYDNGWGVQKDYREAVKWFRLAAEQGYPQAQSILGAMYATGDGVKKDYGEAMKWYRQAAEQGDPEAQRRVGFMYVEGQGVAQNYAEAAGWFQKGAERGHAGCLYWLGRLYYEGRGVERNREKAESLLRQAATQGSEDAVRYLQDVAAQDPTLQKALEAPAWALAQGYLWAKTIMHLLPAADAGATIQLPGETITKSNVDEYRGRYEKRLSLYGEAIKQRGYKTISGTYKGETTESCARIKSLWVGVIHERSQSGIEIAQDGIEAQVVLRGKHEGKELSLKNQAAIAESALSVLDAMNSDYFFRGEVRDLVIVIKPNPSVLDTWPKWAEPPSRSDLESCTITLTPLAADSGNEQR